MNIDALTESYFQHELMHETQAYVARGRTLEHSSDQDVLDTWVTAFEIWFEHRTPDSARSMDDAAAELRLRGLSEPHERVRSKIDALRAEVDQLAPDDHPEGLVQRIVDYLAMLRAPQN